MSKTAREIIARFYSDYPEKPYISNDRPKYWIEQAEMFPKQSIISESIMTRYADGLLPGHVYMLFWLKKYTNKRVPAYFEYKYGVNFEKEKLFLIECGLLNSENKPTEDGEDAIQRHYEVIENHKAKEANKPTIEETSRQILKSLDSLRKMKIKEYEFVSNCGCCKICAALNGKHFPVSSAKIGINAPPMHPDCRCSIAPWEDPAEYEAWLSSISKRKRKK